MPTVEFTDRDAATEAFQRVAQVYCTTINTCGQVPAKRFLVDIHRQLVDVYVRIFVLPPSDAIHSDEEEVSHPSNISLGVDIGALGFQALMNQLSGDRWYFEVFDPWELDDNHAVAGDLADDLWDVYNDLRAGLELWSQGMRESALWEWRFGFESHWGEHVTGAIRALYMLARRHDGLWG